MQKNRSRSGFSLIELLLYVTLFITASVLIVGVLESIVRIQGHENAVSTVTSETNFVMQAIQRVVRETSLIQEASSSLLLRAKNLTKDPTRIYLSSNTIYLQEGNAAPVALTTAQVNASGLTFTKFSNPPSKDTVQIDLTIAYNTSNPRSVFSKTLRSAISKVSAVTFDSSLIPSDTNLKIGTGSQKWQDAFFSGAVSVDGDFTVDIDTLKVDVLNGFVGVGTSSPESTLTIGGSNYLQIGTRSGAPPSGDCDADAEHGRMIYDYANNRLYICDGAGLWKSATTT